MRAADFVVIFAQCIWGVCEAVIKNRMTARGEKADTSRYKALYAITVASLAVGILFGWMSRIYGIPGYSSSIFFPLFGSTVILCGLGVRLRAITTLKKFFTVNVAIVENHQLITTGLYRYIRHPAYAGGILSFVGCGICYGNIPSFVIISLPYIILILLRIKEEEPVLVGQFGDEYKKLQARTKKLIPFIY